MVEGEISEAEILGELHEELRRVLDELGPGLQGIQGQLEAAVAELRRGAQPRSLALAMENLHSFFALLSQLAQSFEDAALPALDRFDGDVQRAVDALDRAVAGGPDPVLVAQRVESLLLPTLSGWSAVQSELAQVLRDRHLEMGCEVEA